MSEPRPERVRVTGPPRLSTTTRARTLEIDEATVLGTVLMGSLVRAQLRLALVTLTPLVLLAGGLPLLFHAVPALADVRIAGAPLAWLVLGGLVYPFFFGLGWFYVRRAERHESQFADLVEIAEGE